MEFLENSIFNLLDLGEKIEERFGKVIAIAFVSIVVIVVASVFTGISLWVIFTMLDVLGARLFGPNYISLF